jgi:hypothetical protein
LLLQHLRLQLLGSARLRSQALLQRLLLRRQHLCRCRRLPGRLSRTLQKRHAGWRPAWRVGHCRLLGLGLLALQAC